MASAERLRAVRLEDVHGQDVFLAALAGAPAVVVYAGRRGADSAIRVGRALQARFQADTGSGPRIVPVACMGEVPSLFRWLARSRVREAAAGIEVLIDFEGALEQALGMQHDVANIAVLNRRGDLVGVVTGGDESCVIRVEAMLATIMAD